MFKIKENTTSLQNLLTEINNLPPTIQLQDKIISPSNIEQTISPDEGFEGFSSIIIQTDENLKAENIIKNIEIFGITGSANAEAYSLTVSIDDGSTVIATKGNLSITGTSANGVCNLTLPESGTWTITATKGSNSDSTTIEIKSNYEISLLPFEITYTGTMTYEDDETTGYRYYEITDSGVLTINRPIELDYWICGGGSDGQKGYYNSVQAHRSGGGGGGGGYFQFGKNTVDTNFTITVGTANANSSIVSSSTNITAASGKIASDTKNGGDGGSGGGGAGGPSPYGGDGIGGKGTGISTIPFGDSHFTSYPCAGGSGGGYATNRFGGSGGSDGGDGVHFSTSLIEVQPQAATGGGYYSTNLAMHDASYYGGGGAGGSGGTSSQGNKGASKGYQGVCFLRVPLSLFLNSTPPLDT